MDAVLRKVQDKIQQNFRRRGGGSKFFSTARRGEGVELHEDLNSNDRERQKNAVKRIIAGMTLGRDVSHLFMDVVKLGQTTNLELKKLVYLYVLNTAKLQPEKALMAVNTFLQDTTNNSPIVRALAIRTMMCIRVDSVTEYTLEPLRRAVTDPDPYVRKTAAIGIGKLFHHNMQTFIDQGFVTELLKLLNDVLPIVSANAAAVLSEINDYGHTPIEIPSEYINRLLHHLSECAEWGQVSIMELIADVRPGDAATAESIVARVIPRLSHTNSSVVMAAVKVIANLANCCSAEAVNQYSARLNSAIVTLAKGDPESQYVVCKNIHALLVIFPNLLRGNLDSFFVRFTDPPYVKLEKLRLLLKVVTPLTAHQIIKEMEEYSTEVDLVLAEEVVKGIAMLALKIESVSSSCTELLLRIASKRPELLPQVVTSCKNIVRKYPGQLVLETLIVEHAADTIPGEEAKVSLIWMLGEFCDFIENGKQIITHFIDELMSHEQSVQLAILSAVIKMFLRDPTGMEPTLNTVLDTLTTRSNDPDLRDRAYAYWRLLSKGVGVAKMKQIVHGHQIPVTAESTFSDAMTMGDLKKSINTAAVVFGKPFHSFLPPYGLLNGDNSEDDEEEDEDKDEDDTAEHSIVSQVALNSHPSLPSSTTITNTNSIEHGKPTIPTTTTTTTTRHADPLDDLFAEPSAANVQQRPSLSMSESTLFYAQNLPHLVVPAANRGVAVHCQLVDGPALWIALVNHQSVAIDQLALQINLNLLGYLPAASISTYLPSVSAGEARSIQLPLRASEQHFDATRHKLEIGIKGQNLQLLVFHLEVPVNKILAPSAPIERSAFVAQWQALDRILEARHLLGDAGWTMLASPDRRGILEQHRFFLLTPEHDSKDSISYHAKVTTTLGMEGLVEIVLSRVTPTQSYVSLKSNHMNFVMPLVLRVLQGAFPSGTSSVTPTTTTTTTTTAVDTATKTTTSTSNIHGSVLDDLFA